MAKVSDYNVEYADGNVAFELEAKSGESFLVKDVMVFNPASNYISLWIDETRVGYFRVGTQLGNHLPFCNGGAVDAVANSTPPLGKQKTLLGYLWDMGIFTGYPVPTGSSFVVTGAQQAGAFVAVIYEKYEEGDITPDMENGVEAASKIWVNYGNSGANITTAADTELDTPENPDEWDDFPYGKSAPSKKETTLLGILASDFAPSENDGTNGIGTKFLKLVRETTTLFDKDKNGLLLYAEDYGDALTVDMVGEGIAVIGNYSDKDGKPPLMFIEPMVFVSGEMLTVILTTIIEGTGQTIDTDEQTVGVILRTTKVA